MLTISTSGHVINRIMVFSELIAQLRRKIPDMYFNNLQPVRLHDTRYPDLRFEKIRPDWFRMHGDEVFEMDLPDITFDCSHPDHPQQFITMDFRFPYRSVFAVLHASFRLDQQNSDDLLFKLRTTRILQDASEQSSEIAFFATDVANAETALERGSEELELRRLKAIETDASALLHHILKELDAECSYDN